MVERGLLRRVAAILFHRRAGFCANGMGVWKVPEEQIAEVGPRMAAFRGISHCYQRPTYADWPYSVFTMAHGRSKEECDAILDAIAADDPGIEDRATLYSSTEFKKVRLLYFTDDFKRWEREHAARLMAVSLTDARSAELYARALQRLPGGVNSPVRAMRAIGRDPIFVERGAGRRARRRRRQPLRRLRLLVGPADPRPRPPGGPRGGRRGGRARARRFGAPTAGRGRARRGGRRGAMPSVEMLRMTSSGTEATMSAIRLARAATGREKLLKFAGAYHGHVDGLLAEAGSGLATQGIPASPGRARRPRPPTTVVVPWNDAEALARGHRRARARRDPRRALPGEHGPRPAGRGLPRAAARARRRHRRAAGLRRGHHRLPRRAAAARRSSPASCPT